MKVRWSDQAKSDLLDLIQFISRERPGAARKLASRIRAAVRGTGRHPFIGRVVEEVGDPQIRERIMPPYRIVYHVGEDILILTLVHGRRDAKRALGLPSEAEDREPEPTDT